MRQRLLLKSLFLLCALIGGVLGAWAQATYEQLTSIADIDESAQYVLGIDGTGFHYEGTSSWGKTALPSAKTPIYYTLTKASDGNSFTAKATISGTTYYLQIPTSNTFSMATSTGTNTDIIIGTTQVSGTNYAVANKSTTARHLRINGTSGLRSYAGTTGSMAFFYKVVEAAPSFQITANSNNELWGTVSIDGFVITASPAEGYTYGDPAYSVSGTATVTQNGNEFTVTPESNCTVTINFAAIPTHSAIFSVNGVTTTQEDYEEGAAITFPANPASIDDKVFMGWVTEAIKGTTNVAPTFVTSATMGNSNVTFYAVFAEATGDGDDTYEIQNSNSFDSNAKYVIGATQTSTNSTMWYFYAYSGTDLNLSWGAMTSDPKNNSPIQFSLSGTANNLKAQDTNGNYLKGLSTGNFQMSSTSTTIGLSDAGDITNGSSYKLRHNYNSGSGGLRWYTSNTGTAAKFYKVIPAVTYSNYCTTVVVPSVARPEITIAENPFLFSTTATITCDTEGATIYYRYTENDEWTEYTGALTITEKTTIYAKAIKNDDESTVASVTATKNLAEPTVTIDATGITNTNVFTGTAAGSLSASVTYNDAPVNVATVTWSGNNNEVATIDPSTGDVTLVGAGTVTFTATYVGNADYSEASDTYEMTVTNENPNQLTLWAEDFGTNYDANEETYSYELTNGGSDTKTYNEALAGGTAPELLVGKTSGAFQATIPLDNIEGNLTLTFKTNNGCIAVTTNNESVNVSGEVASSGTSTLILSGVTPDMTSIGIIFSNNNSSNCRLDDILLIGSQSTKANPELSYATTSYTVGLNASFETPTLTNPHSLIVTYSSSDENLAVVDEATGEVIVGSNEGTVTITASFAGNDDYRHGSASYTITIEDQRIAIATIIGINPAEIAFGATGEFTVNATYASNDPSDYEVTLTSSDTEMVLIDGLEYVAGSTKGNVTVTVQVEPVDETLYKAVEETFTVSIYNPNANDGSKEHPYTVAEAREAIDAGTGITGVYATGVVSKIVTAYSSQNGNITFDISEDGTEDSDQLRAYRCVGTNAENVQVGDVVVVYGNLTMYGDIYEFAQAGQLISLIQKPASPTFSPEEGTYTSAQNVEISCATDGATIYYTTDGTLPTAESTQYTEAILVSTTTTIKAIAVKDDVSSAVATATYEIDLTPTITVSPISVEASYVGAEGTIDVTYNNITNVAAEVYFCDAEGVAATYDWVNAVINSENNVEYIIDANDVEARTAYMKVHALDDNDEEVYSEIITITQAAYVIDYATLPFEWEGGSSAGLLDIAGVTANGLGSDYGSNNSPYLVKFDGTGDYIQVKTDSQPGTVSIYVKMIGGNSSSSITVQGSADGETFTDVEELDISGNQNSTMELVTTKDFAATDRYVRLYFTKGSNVGVGAISITKYVEPVNPGTVPSITVDPYEVDVDANEHDGTLAISYENLTISGTDDFVIQYCDEDGNESEEPDWLEVLVAEQDPQIGEGYVVSYYMLENEGEARSAYFKVYALAGELVFSNLVTVTQAAPVITTTYTLATEIVPGKHYIITNGSNMAMGAQKENNRGAVGVSIVDGIATVSGESQPLEFVIYGPNVDGYYTIYDETASGYLYAASSGSNYLKTQTTLDNNGKWSITFGDSDSEATIEAQGNNSRNLMRFNNSSNLFSCYGSGQQAIYLYVKSEEEAPTETVTITDAKYATFCSKNAFDFSQTGATVYKATVSTQNKVVAMIPVEDGIVPAYTGVILFKDDAGELIVPVSKTKGESVWSDNAMIGTTERTLVKKQNGSNFNYILQQDSESGKIVFNMAKEAGAYMPAGRAYLSTTVDASASNSRLSVMFADDVVTSIAGMNHETSGTANDVYDLQGRKVDTSLMKKGLYIVRSGKNARKVVK